MFHCSKTIDELLFVALIWQLTPERNATMFQVICSTWNLYAVVNREPLHLTEIIETCRLGTEDLSKARAKNIQLATLHFFFINVLIYLIRPSVVLVCNHLMFVQRTIFVCLCITSHRNIEKGFHRSEIHSSYLSVIQRSNH